MVLPDCEESSQPQLLDSLNLIDLLLGPVIQDLTGHDSDQWTKSMHRAMG